MKKLILLMASLAVLALLASAPAARAAYMGEEGQESVAAEMNTYTLGLTGPNFCSVETVDAPDLATAFDKAAKICAKCTIHNLTGEYVYGEAPWEAEPRANSFCGEESK